MQTGGSAQDLLEGGDEYFNGRRFDTALEAYKLAAAAARIEDDLRVYVQGAAQAAHVLLITGRSEEGRDWLDAAGRAAQPEEPAGFARFLLVRGAFEAAGDQHEAAMGSFERAYELALGSSQPERAVQAAHMATVAGRGAEQVHWSRRAIEAASVSGDARLLAALWRQLAWLLEERGLHVEALDAFLRGREVVQDLQDGHEHLVADWSVGHGLRLTGRLDEARALMEEITRRARQRHDDRRQPNDAEWLGHCLRELGELEFLMDERERAVEHWVAAREYFVIAGARSDAPQLLEELDRSLANARRGR